MEPASLAFGLITVFKDTYLTVKWIRNTCHTLKDYQTEQQQLATHFTVQIFFLRNLSRLFCAANSNKVDFELLQGVSDDYIQTVRDVLTQHQRVLADYSKTAAYLDADYKRFLDLSRRSQIESVQEAWAIEDADTPAQSVYAESLPVSEAVISTQRPKRSWLMRVLGGSNASKSKSSPSTPKPPGTPPRLHKVEITIPPNVRWLFKKSELQRTLGSLKRWNSDLRDLVGPLLDAFGFFRNIKLQKRLQSDGSENIFRGHIALKTLAGERTALIEDGELSRDKFIPLEDARARITEPKILTEFKQLAVLPAGESDRSIATSSDILRPMKELYGPQLARLLHTAGIHSFRTLPLNSYTWDAEETRYIYLFDFPAGASKRKPKSLHDLIQSKDARYKLELKQRFSVAQSMARAIGAFHSDGWLHKNIRAHAVKFFFLEEAGDRCDFADPYLTDFEFSRPVSGVTRLLPQALDLQHEVYRHPDRHGMPGIGFNKMHDIYSLGVVLLEIGLWSTAKELYDDVVTYDFKGVAPPGGLPPQKVKEVFLQDAKARLAHRMGTSYQEAVIACLADDWDSYVDSQELAKEFYDRVIQKVDIRAFIG